MWTALVRVISQALGLIAVPDIGHFVLNEAVIHTQDGFVLRNPVSVHNTTPLMYLLRGAFPSEALKA
jgi:hypothetical protein